MSGLELIRALYEYNEWANEHVLSTAAGLDGEQLDRKLGASFDSVRGNLTHVLSAQNVWLSRWTASTPPEAPQAEPANVIEALCQAYDASHRSMREYFESLAEDGLERVLEYTDSRGDRQRAILWQTQLQVANHGTHHRAETAMMLTELGKPPRQLDYVFYELERSGGPPRLT